MKVRLVAFSLTLVVAAVVLAAVLPGFNPSKNNESNEDVYIAHVALCPPNIQDCTRSVPIEIEVTIGGIPILLTPWETVLFRKEYKVPRGGTAVVVAEQEEPKFLKCWWTKANGQGIGRPDQTTSIGTVSCPMRALP